MMEKKPIVLIGGGGHCISVIDVIESTNEFEIMGIIDTEDRIGEKVAGYSVIGSDESLLDILNSFQYFHITLGHIKTSARRRELFEHVIKNGGTFPVIISPYAYCSPKSIIGNGTIIMHHALINSGAVIGENCIINSKSLVEHDVLIEDDVHVSTAAVINGGCKVGSGAFIGSNAMIRQGISIGKKVTIGGGAVVVNDIVTEAIVAGNPAKFLK